MNLLDSILAGVMKMYCNKFTCENVTPVMLVFFFGRIEEIHDIFSNTGRVEESVLVTQRLSVVGI